MSSGKVALNVVTGVLIGGAAGAILGMLFAPEKGSAIRKNLSKRGNDLMGDAKDRFDDFLDDVVDKLKTVKEEESDLTEKVKSKVK